MSNKMMNIMLVLAFAGASVALRASEVVAGDGMSANTAPFPEENEAKTPID